MNYLFIVQGEGRGHMTQALSLAQLLRKNGHEICHVIVGKSKRRELPGFFTEKIGAPLEHLNSPNFVTDKHEKSVNVFRTVVHSFLNAPAYQKSIKQIHKIVKEKKPDVIVNFYEFLGGLYNFSHRPKCQFICVAHQYLTAHSCFEFPPKRIIERKSLQLANKITCLGADKILALSFQKYDHISPKKLYVVPPLLRTEVRNLKVTTEDHLLVYLVNPGYAMEVEAFHQECPDQPIHCFWDKKEKPAEWKVDDTLTFHQLNDDKFLRIMASAKGYVTTAGFESVCEAMYLGKPVLMVPVQGHYEQACNAVDATKAGAGISSTNFEINKLIKYFPKYQNPSDWFQEWADKAPEYFLSHLESAG